MLSLGYTVRLLLLLVAATFYCSYYGASKAFAASAWPLGCRAALVPEEILFDELASFDPAEAGPIRTQVIQFLLNEYLEGKRAGHLTILPVSEKHYESTLELDKRRKYSRIARTADGQIIAASLTHFDHKSDSILIRKLATREDWREKGIARRLICEIAQRGYERAKERLRLSVVRGNTPAIETYKRLGFQIVSEDSGHVPSFIKGMSEEFVSGYWMEAPISAVLAHCLGKPEN